MGGSIMKCINRFHNIRKGLGGCSNDKSKNDIGLKHIGGVIM